MSDIPAAVSNHNTLTIQGLCKYFAGLHALDGVSFSLRARRDPRPDRPQRLW